MAGAATGDANCDGERSFSESCSSSCLRPVPPTQTTNLAAVMESLAKEQSEAEAASRPATARKEARRAAAAAPAAAAPATAPGQEDGEPAVDAPTDGTAVVVPATPGAAPASEPGASNHGSTSVDNSAHLERTPKGSMRVKKGGDKTLGPGGRLEAKVPGTSMAGQGRYAAVAGGR
ncbi:unnamed protein product [Pedinophyceae sp. YPF-701]|nr:unnamed protein product [Pedinophyceae sp. YPF-701]